ncbi:MAG: DUF5916 domain-containing protein [Acidobacteriota bacterium]
MGLHTRSVRLWIAAVVLAGAPLAAHAARQEQAAPAPMQVPRAASPVRVDAVLDEPAWGRALTLTLDYEISPGDNLPPPVRTEVLLAYDERTLYVAFRAHDPEPAAIRAHLTDRDKPYRNDYVGVILDTFNDQRRGYEFFSNPLGVQMDMLRNEVGSGDDDEEEDFSWDAIWDSAGRITADGYTVEMAIPLGSLRFPEGDGEQTWGFTAIRSYPRTVRHQILLNPVDRDRNCFACQFLKIGGLRGLEAGRNVELDPTLTAQRDDRLRDGTDLSSGLEPGSFDVEAGLSARWGVTPNLSLNGALNPDFSQVEADVAQLDVNTRFALFYPEKRPFFLEGADYFSSPLRAVHTRSIADPSWGLKLTGKPGSQAVGVFAARDRTTNLLLPGNQGSESAALDQPATAGVVRYRRDVGEASTVGVLATAREGDEYSNSVAGLDAVFRLGPTDQLDVQWLASRTEYPRAIVEDYAQPDGPFSGHAFEAGYAHETRNWSAWAEFRDLGRGFRADLGFVPQVDLREWEVGVSRTLWGEAGDPYTRLEFGVEPERTEDQDGRLTGEWLSAFASYQGPFQSWGNVRVSRGREAFEGVTYDMVQGAFFFNIRPNGDFTCSLRGSLGDAIDYDNGRPADRLRLTPEFTLDIGRHLAIAFEHTFEELRVEGGRLYRANLSQARIVYQFNVRTFLRAIVQYRDLARDPALYGDEVGASETWAFAQLMLSYKINPLTVFFLGYSDTRDADDVTGLTPTGRTVFVKLGYAWLP